MWIPHSQKEQQMFSWLILNSANLPRGLGVLGIVNAVLLVLLYFATAASIQTLILISGGLTSVLLGPAWWLWLGARLMKEPGS